MLVEIFCCYAHKDQTLLNELKAHLMPLQRQGLIKIWADNDIGAGIEWEKEIEKHLDTAHIILLLVSPDFMDSDYCYGIEMQRALERHDRGEAQVIPIILRPVYFEGTPFSKLQALPTDAKPVTNWHGRNGRDRAFLDIAIGIRKKIEERWVTSKFEYELQLQNLKHTSAEYFQFVDLNPSIALLHVQRGDTLFEGGRYLEALEAYDQAISLEPNYAYAHKCKGDVLLKFDRKEGEALSCYRKALTIDPNIDTPLDVEPRTCPNCERSNKPFTIFCMRCGTNMGLPLKKEPDV
jgi:tetratricopeptide (TPR) repeat protein